MTYVVTEACIRCKHMECVEVCPVDCFYEGANMLVIHPDECIDCGVCEPECPPKANRCGKALFASLQRYSPDALRSTGPGSCPANPRSRRFAPLWEHRHK